MVNGSIQEMMGKVEMSPEIMEARAKEVTAILKTLAHPARLMLVCTLVQGEYSVSELEEKLGIHQPTLSQQLTVLREAGIVETRREGKQIFYWLTAEKTTRLIAALYTIFCADGETA
ncbi:helix-turn-helix transcriptional regulator [Rhizobium sp. KVB221]|uniref:Helix-turn-helix transcriptional regulator n=1 Tax=Rhizobium setariae TaxID=2801340 RepID=A0A937CJ88_9HYPH|nr:sulfite-sensing transcriptional repressor BigR [Rhizobium setariae]MBL0370850.1 helix-turn-helix transcriptional regulator [Rhizobium setariae]